MATFTPPKKKKETWELSGPLQVKPISQPAIRVEAPRPAPTVQPQTMVAPRPAQSIRVGNTYVGPSEESFTAPSYTAPKPRQSFWNKARDILDANTQADQYRRQIAGRQAIAENPGNIISNTVGSVPRMINTASAQIPEIVATAQGQLAQGEYGRASAEYVKAVRSGNKDYINAAKEGLNRASKRVKDIQNFQEGARQAYQTNKGGLFNAGTLYTAEEAKKGEAKTGAKRIGLGTAEALFDVGSLGLAGTSGKVVAKEVGKQGFRKGVQTALKNEAKTIGKNVIANTLQGAAGTARTDASAKDIAKAALISGTVGTVADVGLAVGGGTVGSRAAKALGPLTEPAKVASKKAWSAVGGKKIEDIIEQGNRPINDLIPRLPSLAKNEGGYIQVGRTPKNIHPDDQRVMADFVDQVRGVGGPMTPEQRINLDIEANHIAQRYGIEMPMRNKGAAESPAFYEKALANNFVKRLDVEGGKAKAAKKPSIWSGLGEGGGRNAPRNQAEADVMFGPEGRFSNVDPAVVIAKKYGGDPVQIQRDIDRLGVNGADDLYAGYAERSNARLAGELPETPPPSQIALNQADLDAARARLTSRTPQVEVNLAERYGVKQDTVDRLVRDYGRERAEGALRYMDEASGAGTVKSRDGFAVGQAQKMFGKVAPPAGKARVMSPEEFEALAKTAPPMDTTPEGMDIEPPSTDASVRPVDVTATGKQENLPTQVKNLPDHATAGIEQMPAVKVFSENFDNAIEQARNGLDQDALRRMQDEIVAYHRTGAEISPESKQLYDNIFRPVYDAMGQTRRSSGGTIQDYYLHETRGDLSGERIETGYGFVDTVNQEFGANMHRLNKIDPSEMTDPLTALQQYKEQYLFDKYRVQREAEHYAQQGYADPMSYVKQKNETAQKLAVKVDDDVEKALGNGEDPDTFVTDTSTRQELRENFEKAGNGERYAITNAPKTGYQAQTTRNIYRDLQMDNGQNVYDGWGIKRWEDAEAQGNHIYENIMADGMPNGDTLRQALKDNYAGQSGNAIDTGVEAQLIEQTARRIERESKENAVQFGDPTPSSLEFEKLERDLAAEQIRHFAERTDIPNKSAQKVIDRITELALSGGRRRISTAEKLANRVTSTLHLGALGLNPSSAAQNLTETSRVVGIFGPKTTGIALQDLTTGKVNAKELRHRYGVREDVIEDTILRGDGVADKVRVKGKGKKIESAMMYGFNKTEGAKDALFLRSAEIEADKLGLTGRDKVSYVRTKFEDAFKMGELGSIWATKSPVGRLALQFGQYPMKDWGLTLSKIRDLTVQGKQADAMKYLTGVFGAKAAFLLPMYAIFGAGVQQMFSLSAFRGGPVVSIPATGLEAIRDEQNRVDEARKNGEDVAFDWGNVWHNAGQKAVALGIPGGNFLLNKVGVQNLVPGQEKIKIGGEPLLRQDTTIGLIKKGYNENPKGRARFGAPDNPLDWARAFLGGAYNTGKAREQFGNTVLSVQIPGSKARIGSREGLYPVDRITQARIDATNDKGEKQRLIENNHVAQRGYSEIKQGLNKDQQAVFDQLNGRSDVKISDAAKNEVFWSNPDLLSAVNKYAALQRELGIPSDPLYSLNDEQQRIALHYLDEETASKDKRATKQLNPWIEDWENERDSFFETVRNPESKRTVDTRVPDFPEPNPQLQAVMDTYFNITDSTEKGQFLGEHPEITDQLSTQASWINDKRKARGAPEFDTYPEPTSQVKSYMDAYNSLPKANGPAKRDGTPSSPDRSAWIQSHPNEWAEMTSQWNKQNLWSLQNGLSTTVYRGLNPDESDIQDIAALGKSLQSGGGYGGGGGGGLANAPKAIFGQRRAINLTEAKVKVPKINVKARGKSKKITVKRGGRI